MHEIRIEIDEIDKMLEDLNQKLSEESKLKIELDEYIYHEIDKQHQKLNESMKSRLFEIQSLLSKHKQHLWNHIQAIKRIRSSFISHQEALSTTKTELQQVITTTGEALSKLIEALRSDTQSSLNIIKKEVTSEMENYCANLSQKDGEIDKKVSDFIDKTSGEHTEIITELEDLMTNKESVDSKITAIDNVIKNLDESVISLQCSLFNTDGYLESKLNEVMEHSIDRDSFSQLVQRVNDDSKIKDRQIKRLRTISITQSVLIILIIIEELARLVLH